MRPVRQFGAQFGVVRNADTLIFDDNAGNRIHQLFTQGGNISLFLAQNFLTWQIISPRFNCV